MSEVCITGYLVDKADDRDAEHTGWELTHGSNQPIEIEVQSLWWEAEQLRERLVTVVGFYASWDRSDGNRTSVLVAKNIRLAIMH